MKLSTYFAPTLKEDPKDAEVVSHRLLLRAGFVRKVAAGIYDYLPLGMRSLRKIETIVREEMDRSGAMEILMPSVQPAELWQQSGRWDYYGPELLRMKDRKGGDFCLGPTHEEVVTALVRGEIQSYRQLPLTLYQVQTKFRDELRPRAGLMRGREFIMKDAYSFDADEEAAKRSYQTMYDAYCRVFDRIGLNYRPVEADTGNIGGNLSHEFQVLAESGEDAIVSCPSCGYTANVEKAHIQAAAPSTPVAGAAPASRFHTPSVGSVQAVASLLGVAPANVIKSMLWLADGNPVLACTRGDFEVNQVKLKAYVGAVALELAPEAEIQERLGCRAGFAGPVRTKGLRIVCDPSVLALSDAICGANEDDYHLKGVQPSRDLADVEIADLRLAEAGDPCGRCGTAFEFFKGIEVGQVFYLGTKYSTPMGANFLNVEGDEKPLVMGCYGIGVSRILSAAIEQNHDADGMIWPMAIAPFQVTILPLQLKDEAVVEAAESLYQQFLAAGVEVMMDDRDQRPGFKFKDADLVGIPIRITIGARTLAEGNVELKQRDAEAATFVAIGDVVADVKSRIQAALG
jgi:prolyl-tRNA synthetase